MRIISNFKDYYDPQQKFTTSDNKWYRRLKIEKIDVKNTDYYSKKQFYAGFCGKVYGGLKISWKINNEILSCYCYSYEDYQKTYQEVIDPKFPNIYNREYEREFNSYCKIVEDDSVFIRENCPIYIIKPFSYSSYAAYHTLSRGNNFKPFTTSIEFDPSLKGISFDKILSANLAYMNLESYIHFLSCEHKEVPDMDNKTKIYSHGFDKGSFRRNKNATNQQ